MAALIPGPDWPGWTLTSECRIVPHRTTPLTKRS